MRSRFINSFALAAIVLAHTFPASGHDDNPLNLPEPFDPKSPGMVMLHGGGELSDELRDSFIELAGGKTAKIVLIPSGTYVRWDGESKEEFKQRLHKLFKEWADLKSQKKIADFELLFTDNPDDADDDDKFLKPLKSATGVWIPAAFQGKLSWRFTRKYADAADTGDTLFQKRLREVVARGGVVGGLGGGMAALPEVMIMGKESGDDDEVPRAATYPGLHLFNGAIVDQNFNYGGRLERFTGLLKNTKKLNRESTWPASGRNMIGIAVEQETAVIVQGSRLKRIGNGDAHLFVKANGDRTVQWQILSPENSEVELRPIAIGQRKIAVNGERKNTNPFGIPEPIKGSRPGTVVLHGGRDNSDLMQIYPSLAGVPAPRLVHCPAASPSFQDDLDEGKSQLRKVKRYFHEWVSMEADGSLASLDFLTTSKSTKAKDEDFIKPLKSAHAVWFAGGDQRELARLFIDQKKPTRFQEEVIQVVARGGVVGGSSAGMAVMAKVMTVPGESIYESNVTSGLGVLKNVIVEQHYLGSGRGGRLERFTGVLLGKDPETTFYVNQIIKSDKTDFNQMIGIAVEEQTSLLLKGERLSVFGVGHAHIFLKTTNPLAITWHELEPGDSAFVSIGPDGPVLELDGWQAIPSKKQ